MKGKKHRLTKATDISPETKEKVAERDSIDGYPCCILCGAPGNPDAHFVGRGQVGLGIEQNVVTLCPKHHRQYDNGTGREQMRECIRAYLQNCYPDWDETKLCYRKGM